MGLLNWGSGMSTSENSLPLREAGNWEMNFSAFAVGRSPGRTHRGVKGRDVQNFEVATRIEMIWNLYSESKFSEKYENEKQMGEEEELGTFEMIVQDATHPRTGNSRQAEHEEK
ncbi:hypothetical protein R1flu_005140 [Riccia fluitans]|uniref:Uncharacterized protein n=1 Tax=Riccia fluitans TaxID=41844 RepID=A0ABD1YSB4_9MARC